MIRRKFRRLKFIIKNNKLLIFELEAAFYVIILSVFVLDQLTKLAVHRSLALGASFPLIDNIFHLTYVRNTGAAFSLFSGFSSYLTVAGIIIAGAIFYFHLQAPITDFLMQVALAFILGGSLGNLADRFFRGYVVDFLDFRIWPVFNVADIAINVGVVFLMIQLLRKK